MMIPRTYLFVPGDRADRLEKALASGADAVVLDLEDAVTSAAKDAARDAVVSFVVAADASTRARLVVRINDEATPWFDADTARLGETPTPTLMLPKAETAAQVARVRTRCPGAQVLALVETARGVQGAASIAACDGVGRLAFGTIDYALDLDLPDGAAGLETAASLLAIASRAAGLPAPVAGVTTELRDTSRLLADLGWARSHGFGAKLCIHPAQVAPIHAALQPTDVELAWARRVVETAAQGGGAVQLDGRMVDRPVVERARRLLERAGRG